MSTKNAREWAELYANEVIRKYEPNFRIRYKRESKLFKFLSPIIKLIIPKFYTNFQTTAFNTLWVTDDFFDRAPADVVRTVAHEGQHIYDQKKMGILFYFLYAFPQILFVPMAMLAWLLTSWIMLGLALLFLAPIPSYWRYKLELAGYRMNHIWNKHVWKTENDFSDERIINTLSSIRTYYWCWPFKVWIKKDLSKPVDERHKTYKDTIAFLRRHGWAE